MPERLSVEHQVEPQHGEKEARASGGKDRHSGSLAHALTATELPLMTGANARLASMEIHPFRADHLDGELALCVAEGWPELQAFLTSIAVNVRYRGRGIGRALVEASLRMAGAERIDLLSEEASVGFYESFPHFRKPGFRLYPFYQPNEDSGA